MPMVIVHVRYAGNDASGSFYSPSTCIFDYVETGAVYTVEEFQKRMLEGLEDANKRVAKKFGFGCFGTDMEMEKIRDLSNSSMGDKIEVTEMRTI